MKQSITKVFLLFALFFGTLVQEAFAQVITTGPDSSVVRAADDPLPVEQKGWSKPGKAALFSAIIPGAGQVYNGSYWKVPIIYAAGGVLVYFIRDNHTNYLGYKQGIAVRMDTISSNDIDEFTERLGNRSKAESLSVLRRGRDTYRRWRDYTVLYTVLAYTLNITEAYVHAHLKGFDISDELTMQVQPDVIFTSANSVTPGFSIHLRFKN